MDLFLSMSPAHAAALHLGLLTLLMLGLKIYVGARRGQLRVPSGDTSNAGFARATRVQMNAVEDVPVLMAGLLGLAFLGMPAWYIHAAGGVLFIARILHAAGLAQSSGFTFGRAAGTMGTFIVYLGIALPLLVHAFGAAG